MTIINNQKKTNKIIPSSVIKYHRIARIATKADQGGIILFPYRTGNSNQSTQFKDYNNNCLPKYSTTTDYVPGAKRIYCFRLA